MMENKSCVCFYGHGDNDTWEGELVSTWYGTNYLAVAGKDSKTLRDYIEMVYNMRMYIMLDAPSPSLSTASASF